MKSKFPMLYSFRRCPYAMRARMALVYADITTEVRELILSDKPKAFTDLSPKGTVPVLQTEDGSIIDESIDIMRWAITQKDDEDWLAKSTAEATLELIEQNDTIFTKALNRYKYPELQEAFDKEENQKLCVDILTDLNNRLNENGFLVDDKVGLADIAVFPFVRQYAAVNQEAFNALELTALSQWLDKNLESSIFLGAMAKYPVWEPGTKPNYM